ncbi:MAG: hypothetical protein EA001_13030 [Oscillatoriales cyanobacterium]|nr:MAG: hypothetical protein EA001_13030 [Oscillatoriales cyanobacterium]
MRRWVSRLAIGVLGSLLAAGGAIALPPEEIAKKLETVPVFTLTDAQGAPALVEVGDRAGQRRTVARMFVSPQDAIAWLDRLKASTPNAPNALRVSAVPLSAIYELLQKPSQDYQLQLIPDLNEVKLARELLDRNQQPQEKLQGIPLFLVTASDGSAPTYVTVDRDGVEEIQFFMDRAQAEVVAREFAEQVPDLAATVQIQVVDLDEFLAVLSDRDDEWLTRVRILPSTAAQNFFETQPPRP